MDRYEPCFATGLFVVDMIKFFLSINLLMTLVDGRAQTFENYARSDIFCSATEERYFPNWCDKMRPLEMANEIILPAVIFHLIIPIVQAPTAILISSSHLWKYTGYIGTGSLIFSLICLGHFARTTPGVFETSCIVFYIMTDVFLLIIFLGYNTLHKKYFENHPPVIELPTLNPSANTTARSSRYAVTRF